MPLLEETYKSLREEILKTKDHAFQRSGTKIAFVTTLMGLGSVNPRFLDSDPTALGIHVEPLLYLAPLASVFYDSLLFSDKISVRRIGSYIRESMPDEFSGWERWVHSKRLPPLANLGELGFTALTLLYCPIVAWHRHSQVTKGMGHYCKTPFSMLSRSGFPKFIDEISGWWFLLLIFIWLVLQLIWWAALTPSHKRPGMTKLEYWDYTLARRGRRPPTLPY